MIINCYNKHMSMEMPNLQENVAEEDPTKKVCEQIVGEAFGGKEGILNQLGEETGGKEMSPEKTDKEVERWQEGFVESLEADPRFGNQEEYLERLKNELRAIDSPDEKKMFLRGVADFRRGDRLLREIASKIEKVENHKKVDNDPKDNLAMRGILLRSVLDKSCWNIAVESDLKIAERYKSAFGENVVKGLKNDYERALNEGDTNEWGGNFNQFDLVSRLKGFGIEASYERSEERKRNIFTLKEKEG